MTLTNQAIGEPEEPPEDTGERQQLTQELLSNIDRVKDLINSVLTPTTSTDLAERAATLEGRLDTVEGERQQLIEELKDLYEQHDRLMGLYVASYQLHASLDPAGVQKAIAEIAINLLGAESFALLLLDRRTGACEIAITEGTEAFLAAGSERYEGGDPLVDATLEDGVLRLESTEGSSAVAAVPLKLDQQIVGALVIYKLFDQKSQLRDADRDLLDLLAAHAATALVAARVYARAKRKLRAIEGLMTLSDDAADEDSDSDEQRPGAFSGNLEDMPVVDLLQFVHFGSRTGTLVLRPGDVEGRIVFENGQVIAARAPDEPGIGDRLRDKHIISGEVLEEIHALSMGSDEPIGSLFVQEAHVGFDEVLRAAREQIEGAAQELMQWNRGLFEFHLGEVETAKTLGLPLNTVRDYVVINTQMLLIESARIQDEREHEEALPADGEGEAHSPFSNERATPVADEPSDDADTGGAASADSDEPDAEEGGESAFISEKAVDELFERAMRMRPGDRSSHDLGISPSVAHKLRSAFHSVRVSMATSSVAVHLLELVSRSAERGVLFVIRGRDLIPIGAFGQAESGKQLGELTQELDLYAVEGAVHRVLHSSRPEVVDIGSAGLPQSFIDKVGVPATGEVAFIPVLGSDRPILMVYADNGALDEGLEALEVLDLLVAPIGLALENELLRRRLASLSR